MPEKETTKKDTQATSQKMYIDLSGRGGLAPRWYGDEGDTIAQNPQYRSLGKEDLTTVGINESTASDMAAGAWNSARRFGFMCPINISFTTLTTTGDAFAQEWRATLYDPSVGSFYMAENGPNIFAGPSGGVQTALRDPINIAGTSVKVTDLETYTVNGVRKLFFSYQESASGGNIGIMVPTAQGAPGTNNNTWFQATAANGFYLGATNDHFMVVADNGFMYVGDGNYLHKVDGTVATGGTNGTLTSQVLVAPGSFTFTDGVDFKGHVWLTLQDTPTVFADTASYSTGTCGVYLWDRQTTVVNMEDYIPLKGVKNVKKIYVTQTGKVRIICMSSKRTVQIREFDGSIFQIIEEGALISWPTYRDSVTIAGNLVYWLGQDGRFYAHGAIVPGEEDRLFIYGDATALPQTSFTTGAILFFENTLNTATVSKTSVYFSIKDATPTVFNRVWYPNKTGATSGTGNVYTLVKYFPQLVKVNYARVYHNVGTASVPATTQGTLNIYLNQATSSPVAFTITQQDVARGFRYCPVNQGAKNAVFAIQANIQWPAVTTSDATDWMPRLLEIDYTPLPKLM